MLYTACPEKHGLNYYIELDKSRDSDYEYINFVSRLTIINTVVGDFDDPTSTIKYCQYKDSFGNLVEQYPDIEDKFYLSEEAYKAVKLGAYKKNSVWLDKGKYIITRDKNDCIVEALRYGDKWDDNIIGDNLIYQLCCRIDDLEKELT